MNCYHNFGSFLSLIRNTSLVATEHGWLPPEGAHLPQGTYPIIWRGETLAGHSLTQCYTRMMMQGRSITYWQWGGLEWDHHNQKTCWYSFSPSGFGVCKDFSRLTFKRAKGILISQRMTSIALHCHVKWTYCFLAGKTSSFLFLPPTTKTPYMLVCSVCLSNEMTPMSMVTEVTIHPIWILWLAKLY